MKYNEYKDKYFSCYSPNLKDYLVNNGFAVFKTFTHFKTDKICWIFVKTPELPIYLEQWSNNKKNDFLVDKV